MNYHAGKSEFGKDQFYHEMGYESDQQNFGERILGIDDFNGHAGR